MTIHPNYAVLKFPVNLPKQPLRVRTVYPDKALSATMWAAHHRVVNKVCITLADRCDLEGFDFTGTEIDLDYSLGAAKRLKDHQSAPRLFAPEALVQPVQTSLYE